VPKANNPANALCEEDAVEVAGRKDARKAEDSCNFLALFLSQWINQWIGIGEGKETVRARKEKYGVLLVGRCR
jgi:hypothetical protein